MNRWNELKDATLELMEVVMQHPEVDRDALTRVVTALQGVAVARVVTDFEPQDLYARGLFKPLGDFESFVSVLEERLLDSEMFDDLIERVYHEVSNNRTEGRGVIGAQGE